MRDTLFLDTQKQFSNAKKGISPTFVEAKPSLSKIAQSLNGINEELSQFLVYSVNQPSMGYFRVSEHVQRTTSPFIKVDKELRDSKKKINDSNIDIKLAMEAFEDVKTFSYLKNILKKSIFTGNDILLAKEQKRQDEADVYTVNLGLGIEIENSVDFSSKPTQVQVLQEVEPKSSKDTQNQIIEKSFNTEPKDIDIKPIDKIDLVVNDNSSLANLSFSPLEIVDNLKTDPFTLDTVDDQKIQKKTKSKRKKKKLTDIRVKKKSNKKKVIEPSDFTSVDSPDLIDEKNEGEKLDNDVASAIICMANTEDHAKIDFFLSQMANTIEGFSASALRKEDAITFECFASIDDTVVCYSCVSKVYLDNFDELNIFAIHPLMTADEHLDQDLESKVIEAILIALKEIDADACIMMESGFGDQHGFKIMPDINCEGFNDSIMMISFKNADLDLFGSLHFPEGFS
eukprot:TRINITY_DN3258_c1_g2_i1.p1 TRINITY_DN3258_c1_g2~~TRINITY_DN3258_c1_g2_i1.p1  ORF type:complete len:466 (+),score=132.52 TRINITY_DN3258_c1_g2_i1:31-1398(+)